MNWKTRAQWGWFRSALLGMAIGALLAPAAGSLLRQENAKDKNGENPLTAMLQGILVGSRTKIVINGDIVALARSEEEAKEAFRKARLAYNSDGVQILDITVQFEDVDKEKDAEKIKGMRTLKEDALSDAILDSFASYVDTNKELAYTVRVNENTVTIDQMDHLVAVLEQAQAQYDTDDQFEVDLVRPASQNVSSYEVGVSKKKQDDKSETSSSENSAQDNTAEGTEEATAADTEKAANDIAESTEETTSADTEVTEDDAAEDTEDAAAPEDADEKADASAQGADDGVKYVGFAEKIEVFETYVDQSQVKNQEEAYTELTEQKDEPGIYVVKSGDYLDLIAKKNNMTVDQIKELNPQIESDENLYYDDRLNVTVPTAPIQILVQKQETYEEKYNEDVVYEDDNDLYIGETEVVQEGSEGTHIVTDLVTYVNDVESSREELEENVEVAAVAQVVKRGTKSKPTYMYPVTNWNVTSNFGYRWGRLHAGTDVGVPIGTTVRASRAGQVVTAGWVGGYGNCVMIDHGDGIWTVYGHLSEILTSVGTYVDQGEQIALSGNTGRSTGPHLHFEIRVNGSATDATPYLEGTAN